MGTAEGVVKAAVRRAVAAMVTVAATTIVPRSTTARHAHPERL
ncbi:MAG: hypothetical protein ACOC0E_05490 [Spirochaetota bacterium]